MSSKPSTSRKKGHVIPSRFKQAADSFSGQSSKHSVADATLQSRSHSPRRSDKESWKQSLAHEKDESCISRCESAKKCTSSTPTSEGHYTLPCIDESVIADAENFLRVPGGKANLGVTLKKGTTKASFQKNKVTDQTLNVTMSQQGRKKSNRANELDESEINLLYVEYLQAKLLESRTKKAFKNRCKDALDKIYQVWCYIEILMGKNAKTQKELSLINYFIMTHEHLSKQEKMLSPILKVIPTLEKQYDTIAKAVDTTRHNLEVKDIDLPDANCEEEIVQLLKKISALLSIIINIVPDCDKIIVAAEIKYAFVNQGKLLSNELKRASDMLSEASSLLSSETSLKLSFLNID